MIGAEVVVNFGNLNIGRLEIKDGVTVVEAVKMIFLFNSSNVCAGMIVFEP